MKKLMLTCVMICAISVVSFAQNSSQSAAAAQPNKLPSTAQMGEGRAKDMKIQYNMTDAQYKKSVAIETEFFNQQRQIANDPNGSKGAVDQNRMMEIMAQKDAKYKQVMTADQYTKYDAARPKMTATPARN